MKNLYFSILFFLVFTPFRAFTQNAAESIPPINTDRPTQGNNSAEVVPKGYFQLETGIWFSRSVYDPSYFDFLASSLSDRVLISREKLPVHDFNLPAFLFKYGLMDKLEIRVGSKLLHSNRNTIPFSFEGSPDTYLSDLLIGVKFKVLQFSDSKGALSLLAETNIPESRTGKHLHKIGWRPMGSLISSYFITNWFQVTANLSHNLPGAEKKYSYLNPGWALMNSFTINKRISIFTKWHGESFIKGNYHSTIHKFDVGILYLLNSNLQLDFSGGLGDLKQELIDYKYNLSAGFSWRTRLF